MPKANGRCLHDLWQRTSAPMFHTSEFWPVFTNDAVMDFLHGKTEQPIATTPINRTAILEARQKINIFISQINDLLPTDWPCKSAYLEFEESRLVELALIEDAENQSEITRNNDFIYGKLSDLYDKEALDYLAYYIRNFEPRSELASKAKHRLSNIWPDNLFENEIIATLSDKYDKLRQAFRPYVERKFTFLDRLLDKYETRLDSSETAQALNEALRQLMNSNDGWSAVERDGAPNVFIDYDTNSIVVPHGRTYSKASLKGLIIHEVGVHVTRSINGARSREKLAAVGMRGYGPAEEAMGALFEHAVGEKIDINHSLVAFAIIDFSKQPEASFRTIHSLTKDLLICIENFSVDELALKKPDFDRLAFSRCLRMLRLGTNQIVDRSTTKYWRGLKILSDYYSTRQINEATIEEFLAGKYDCTNPAQLTLLKLEH